MAALWGQLGVGGVALKKGLRPYAFRHLVADRLDDAGLTAQQIADYPGTATAALHKRSTHPTRRWGCGG